MRLKTLLVGPFITAPVGVKREPCRGQSQLFWRSFQATIATHDDRRRHPQTRPPATGRGGAGSTRPFSLRVIVAEVIVVGGNHPVSPQAIDRDSLYDAERDQIYKGHSHFRSCQRTKKSAQDAAPTREASRHGAFSFVPTNEKISTLHLTLHTSARAQAPGSKPIVGSLKQRDLVASPTALEPMPDAGRESLP